MKIAGIYPQKILLDPKIQHAVSEPYGLEKILAVAKQEGHDTELFIPINIDENKLIQKILDYKPDIAGFSVYTCQYPMAKRIAAELKKRNPNIITIAGNRYPTFLGKNIEEPFDFFVLREGEETFRELLYEIQNGKNYNRIKGLAFKKNGKGFITPVRERIRNLDAFPDAIRHKDVLSQIYKAISIPPLSSNPHYAVMEYSRGCYNTCKFCDNAGFWRTKDVQVTYRSPKRVVEEMFKIQEMADPVIFYFMDLNFTADHKKAMELVQEMKNQNLKASWYCMSNIATAENQKELLTAMRETGCYKIAFGIESTNNHSLEKMNKNTNGSALKREQAIKVLEEAASIGFLNQGFYIIGFDWETEESIRHDAESLNDLPLHQLNVGIYTPIPLSAFYNKYKSMELDPDLEKHDRNTLIFKHPKGITRESIKGLQEDMHSQFYSSLKYIEHVKSLVQRIPELRQGFNDYFEFLGKEVKI